MPETRKSKTRNFFGNNNDPQGHVHDHTGITSCNDMHCHIHPGVTSPPIPAGRSHYHEIAGATTYQDGHFHTYLARTGTSIPVSNGSHTHQASFTTSFDNGHSHRISGFVEVVRARGTNYGNSDWEDKEWPFAQKEDEEKE